MDEGGTYLEDFLLSLELLPNDMRRDFELLKELDRECIELNRELVELENAYIANQLMSKRSANEVDEAGRGDIAELRKMSENQVNRIVFLRNLAKEKLAEKTAIAINMDKIIERFSRKLDTDLAFFETDLKGCGEFETTKGAEPGSEVAFSITPDVPVLSTTLARALTTNSSSTSLARMAQSTAASAAADASAGESLADKSMILGRVICYRPDTGEYEILDVDDSKKYVLPERQVVILDLQESQRKLSKGETVFALYPDTTSFYPAVVSHAPRRTAMGAEPSVVVQFSGDEDENGVTPDRIVPLKYVVRMVDPKGPAGLSRANTGSLSNSSLANMYS